MFDSVCTLASPSDELIGLIAIGGGILIAIMAIIMSTAVRITRSKETERSRREIAAYIAEGSISPDEGERLMNSGPRQNRC